MSVEHIVQLAAADEVAAARVAEDIAARTRAHFESDEVANSTSMSEGMKIEAGARWALKELFGLNEDSVAGENTVDLVSQTQEVDEVQDADDPDGHARALSDCLDERRRTALTQARGE